MTLPPAASLHQASGCFYQRWQSLNDWLRELEPLWRPIPFMEPAPAWRDAHPDLAHWLEALPEGDCQDWEERLPELSSLLAGYVPALARYRDLLDLPRLATEAEGRQAELAEVAAVDMPGRKRQQAGAFAAAISPLGYPVLDWCSGKGHLGRTLARRGAGQVTGFEWNPELVTDGNRLAEHYGDPVRLSHQDVMVDGLKLPERHHGVALHACGDLHRRLMQSGAQARLPRLSLSPCCYHLTGGERYQLQARQTREYGECLSVDRNDLRLAVQETVTAPERVREQTTRISTWRLGFDALQRELTGNGHYLPVPSHPARLNNGRFEDFCRWAAAKKQLTLTADVDWAEWLARGEARYRQVRRHELLRHLFRRPLELWLVLDYAVFLEEQGYRVRLGTFCDRQLTPRNLLLDAEREGG
ncbi:methyltransferase [Marinobacter nauticus]|uniref:methyltransferase n=1 Tax=Marinobacter nauticus TaxID=2743 RepID=UPI000EB3623A|nr:methyltransferase [Marinobacter nauticus]MBW3198193.1 SAM-dependent methyltransferase [Marinobacter nauticus]MBY6183603.1 SAM-dependent methyltransferase [Marinobacter nauticus]MBY6195299.1 SAM-dependent methyltransferase [Marinobacter nauticus]MBY6216447.1 SAM-dependent methyltransferase [Marinobacter nauticus]RKR78534.1 methyltransferase family protein [Marinobacter nauticus]